MSSTSSGLGEGMIDASTHSCATPTSPTSGVGNSDASDMLVRIFGGVRSNRGSAPTKPAFPDIVALVEDLEERGVNAGANMAAGGLVPRRDSSHLSQNGYGPCLP